MSDSNRDGSNQPDNPSEPPPAAAAAPGRREALVRLAKYGAYTGPMLLAMLTSAKAPPSVS